MKIAKLNSSSQNHADTPQATTLTHLPDECLFHIFENLSMRDLGALAVTSKRISRIARDCHLWQPVIEYCEFVFKNVCYLYELPKNLEDLSVFERKIEADKMLKRDFPFSCERWRCTLSRALGIGMFLSCSYVLVPSPYNDKQPMETIRLLLKAQRPTFDQLQHMLYDGIASLAFNDNFDIQVAKLLIELLEREGDEARQKNGMVYEAYEMLCCALDHRCSLQIIELLINVGYVPKKEYLGWLIKRAISLNLPKETIELLENVENAKNRIPIEVSEVAAPTKKNKSFCMMQ